MDLCILAFEFLTKGDMSASDMPSLTIYRNQRYLTPELEALNEDFEYTYSAEKYAPGNPEVGKTLRNFLERTQTQEGTAPELRLIVPHPSKAIVPRQTGAPRRAWTPTFYSQIIG